MPLSAADRGSAIHDALGEFTQDLRRPHCPTIPRACLRGIGEIFRAADGAAGSAALWWPRFQRIAAWFADWEIARGATMSAAIDAEIRGEIKIPLDNERTFILSARADRIERRR